MFETDLLQQSPEVQRSEALDALCTNRAVLPRDRAATASGYGTGLASKDVSNRLLGIST